MENIRKIADGVIEAPAIVRQDAATALAVWERIAHANDAWDGTVDDLAGYLRMMGSYITGYLQIKEIMPENEEIRDKFEHIMGGGAVADVFIFGDPQVTGPGSITGLPVGDGRLRSKFNSYDPAVRDLLTACEMLNMAMKTDGTKRGADKNFLLYKSALDRLDGYHGPDGLFGEFAKLMKGQPVFNGTNDVRGDPTEMRLASLAKTARDMFGVTQQELDLEDMFFFSGWRYVAATMGIHSKYPPKQGRGKLGIDLLEKMGMHDFNNSTIDKRPQYLPPLYDRAWHMASNPSRYTARDVLYATLPQYIEVCVLEGGERPPWAQLRVCWMIAQAVLAGGLELHDEAGHELLPADQDIKYFTAGQLKLYVERCEVLLDRLRPWLGDNEEFQKLDKEVKEWREKYIAGKDANELQHSVPMRAGPSYWPAEAGSGSGIGGASGSKKCEFCGKSPETLKICSACRSVWYCNAKCQKAGWKAHKKACIASRKSA